MDGEGIKEKKEVKIMNYFGQTEFFEVSVGQTPKKKGTAGL